MATASREQGCPDAVTLVVAIIVVGESPGGMAMVRSHVEKF